VNRQGRKELNMDRHDDDDVVRVLTNDVYYELRKFCEVIKFIKPLSEAVLIETGDLDTDGNYISEYTEHFSAEEQIDKNMNGWTFNEAVDELYACFVNDVFSQNSTSYWGEDAIISELTTGRFQNVNELWWEMNAPSSLKVGKSNV